MGNRLSKASEQVGRVAVRAVDYVVANRVADAEAMVRKARAAVPGASHRVVADAVISRVAREMATLGAVAGAVAVAPGVGTGTAIATSAADVGVAFGRIATMVIAVGLAYDVDLTEHDVRRAFVYDVLSGSDRALTDRERRAGEMKRTLGKQAVNRKATLPAMAQMNDVLATRVGAKVVEKLVTKELTLKLMTLLPLGIGAGVGAVGNRALVTGVGRTAKARAESARAAATGDAPRRALPPGAVRRRVGERVRRAKARLI